MHRRRVVGDLITCVGIDVHKDGIAVVVAEGGIRGEVREYGRIANAAAGLTRLLSKLGGAGVRLRFCYEAGPCGYGIQRRLSTRGHRAGELTAVWVRDARHEAMRDLVRARLDAVHALRRARQQLSGFLLRPGVP
jgi:hypothetical protein